MIIKKHIHPYLFSGLSLIITACIGEDPNAPSDETAATATPAATSLENTTPQQAPATPAALSGKQVIYTVSTAPHPHLHHYYTHHYTSNNLTLAQKDEHDRAESIKDKLDALPKWSAPKTRWTNQYGMIASPPLSEADARIANDQHPSTLQLDGHIVLQNLSMDENTGLYIPSNQNNSTTLLMLGQLTMHAGSWIDVRGRMGAAILNMEHGSVIDLTNGYGFSVMQDKTSIKYDPALTPTGVFKVEEDDKAYLDGATITAHAVELKGELTARNSTINLHTRRVSSGEPDLKDIRFTQKAQQTSRTAKLQAKDTASPEHVITINGPAHFLTGSEMRLLVGNGKVSTVTLNYPFSITAINDNDSDRPTLEGKITLTPTKGTLALNNTEEDKPLLMIKSNIGFQKTIDVSQLLTSRHFLRKTFTLQQKALTEPGEPRYAQGLFLKITDNASALSGGFTQITPPLQPIFQSTLLANFKADIQQLNTLYPPPYTLRIFHVSASGYANDSSAYSNSIGIGKSIPLNNTRASLQLKGMVHQLSQNSSLFANIPDANGALNVLNYSARIEYEYSANSVKIAPSIGASYMLIPETVHQVAFQTLHPEIAINAKYTLQSDSYALSIAGLMRGTLQTQGLDMSSVPVTVDSGFITTLETNGFSGHLQIINPFHQTSECSLKMGFSY